MSDTLREALADWLHERKYDCRDPKTGRGRDCASCFDIARELETTFIVKSILTEASAEREQGRAEMRELGPCKIHPMACWAGDQKEGDNKLIQAHCAWCLELSAKDAELTEYEMAQEDHERRIKEAVIAALKPWLQHGPDCAFPILPSNACTCGLARINPDDIAYYVKVK